MSTFRYIQARLQTFFSGKAGLRRAMAFGFMALLLIVLPAGTQAGGCLDADITGCIAHFFIFIFEILTGLMGFILLMEVDALIRVAQYHNFVAPGPTAVQLGWVVTRDLANMFFIIFLLIIAFSTIVGYAKYHYEKNLFKLLVMAIVINFSKTICGLFIDMSQVLLLSFVNGFKAAAGGNFLNALQVSKMLALADGNSDYTFGLVMAMLLAFILTTIAVCVVLVMLVMLVFRIVMLWILIILSPIAFLTSAFPLGGNYYADWWKELKKYLVGGPVIAFFLWLALATAQRTEGKMSGESYIDTTGSHTFWGVQSTASTQEQAGTKVTVGTEKVGIPSQAGTTDTILSMIIAICILFAGLKFASDPSIGGMASGFAGSVRNKAQGVLKSAVTAPGGWALNRGKETALRGGGMFARVPLLGGLGRASALRAEALKKGRIGEREKTFGTAEDMARLSPGAFNRTLGSLATRASQGKLDEIDKKRMSSMLDIGLKNPKLASQLGASGIGAQTLNSLIKGSNGKSLQDAVGTMMTDKNASTWARQDPALLNAAYAKVKGEAFELDAAGEIVKRNAKGEVDKDGKAVIKDPNMLKTLGEVEQKFAAQLIQNKKMDQARLKDIVPKLSAEDIGNLDKDGVRNFMPHMSSSQFSKILTDGKPEQLAGAREAAEIELDAAKTSKDEDKVAAAAVRAISVGQMKVGDMDAEMKGVLGRRVDTAALARNVNKEDPDQLAAAREVMKAVALADPIKARNLSRNDAYSKIMPSRAEIDAMEKGAKSGERTGLSQQAPNLIADLDAQLKTLAREVGEDAAAGRPTTAKDEQVAQLTSALETLQKSTERRADAEKELAQMTKRLTDAQSGGADAGALSALQGSLDRLNRGIQDMDSGLAKQVAALKGVKFTESGGQNSNKRNRSGGGGNV